MKKVKMVQFAVLIVLCSLLLLLLSCGGDKPKVTGTPLTSMNAPQAVAGVYQAAEVVGLLSNIDLDPGSILSTSESQVDQPGTSGPIRNLVALGESIARNHFRSTRLLSGAIIEETQACPEGGSVDVYALWDGPADPVDASEVVDPQVNITLSDCSVDSFTVNGSMEMGITGSLDAPTKISLSIDASIIDSLTDTDMNIDTFSLEITGSGLSAFDLDNVSMLMSGSISGSLFSENVSIEYDDFNLIFSSYEEGVSVSISGKIMTSCLDKWLTITTTSPLIILNFEECPSAGRITATADGNSVRAVFESDYQINIYYNDTLAETYASCDDFAGVCVLF